LRYSELERGEQTTSERIPTIGKEADAVSSMAMVIPGRTTSTMEMIQ